MYLRWCTLHHVADAGKSKALVHPASCHVSTRPDLRRSTPPCRCYRWVPHSRHVDIRIRVCHVDSSPRYLRRYIRTRIVYLDMVLCAVQQVILHHHHNNSISDYPYYSWHSKYHVDHARRRAAVADGVLSDDIRRAMYSDIVSSRSEPFRNISWPEEHRTCRSCG